MRAAEVTVLQATPSGASCVPTFSDQFTLRSKPILHVASLGATLFYLDFVCALTDIIAFLQLRRRHLELIRQLADRSRRGRVADLPIHPSIPFCLLSKLACPLQ
jgi:hypothetical protein